MDARCHAVVMTVENQKETKKKSVTAGLYEDPDRLVVVKKRGCDWGACGRPRRRDLATSLALRDGRGEGGPARGQGPRGEGFRCAQASRQNEAWCDPCCDDGRTLSRGRHDGQQPERDKQKTTVTVGSVSYTHLTLPTICSV